MTTKDCKTIRQRIDESSPVDQLGGIIGEHLRGCAECRSFEAEHRALQGLMAGLGTVTAPADFDFRLRARIARETSTARNGGGLATFLRLPHPIAVAALVLLLAVGGIAIRNWLSSRRAPISTAENRTTPAKPDNAADKSQTLSPNGSDKLPNTATAVNTVATRENKESQPRSIAVRKNNNLRNSYPAPRNGGGTATRDMALGSAPVVMSTNGSVVRVPLDDQALRILIDDGRGVPHTVSLPIVSFGSQRLMSHSFVPATSSSKGVW